MTSHLGVMMLFAAAVSIVFATLQRDAVRAQLHLAGRLFAALVGGAYVAGWLMHLIFR
jgi:hypothetical protein